MTERYRDEHGNISGDALVYLESQSREERERLTKPFGWLKITSERFSIAENPFYANPKPTPAIEAAVLALNAHLQTQTKKVVSMSTPAIRNTNVTLAEKFGFTESELDLIKRTVAKNATDDELGLFFYRAKALQLNPLMPGQIFFIKYGNSPGTIVIGIDGFRSRAHATGKLSGVERGVIRNEKGVCTGAWTNVYRSDWTKPAHEEVSLHEYNTGKGNWLKMPETMIKKVSEVAALRIAFPAELGGLYLSEEMDQASPLVKDVQSEVVRKPSDAQLKRLFAISKSQGLTTDELKTILSKDYGHDSTKDLTLDEYNELCARLETKTIIQAKESLEGPSEMDQDANEAFMAIAEEKAGEVPWAKYREAEMK